MNQEPGCSYHNVIEYACVSVSVIVNAWMCVNPCDATQNVK